MRIVHEDGVPVLVSRRNRHQPPVRLRSKNAPSRKLQSTMQRISYDDQVAISIRHRKALSNWLSGNMTKTEAARKEGFKSPAVINTALEKLSKNEAFVAAMEDAGVTDQKIAETIAEGLEAQHPLAEEGRKDYHAIAKFVDQSLKVKDVYPATKIKQETESKHIHIHMTSEDTKAYQEFKRLTREESEVS